MNSQQYLNEFVKKIERSFDIEYNKEVFDLNFDMTAAFNQRSAKFMLLKSAEIYAFKNNEYIFYKRIEDKLNNDLLEKLKIFLNKHFDKIVQVDKEHMSSVITFIICSDETPDDDIIKNIKKFKFYKSFSFGLKGWVNAKLIFVNPNDELAVVNKFAKGTEKILFDKK